MVEMKTEYEGGVRRRGSMNKRFAASHGRSVRSELFSWFLMRRYTGKDCSSQQSQSCFPEGANSHGGSSD